MHLKPFFRNRIVFPIFVIALVSIRLYLPQWEQNKFIKMIGLDGRPRLVLFLNPSVLETCPRCMQETVDKIRSFADQTDRGVSFILEEGALEKHEWLKEYCYDEQIIPTVDNFGIKKKFKLGTGNYLLVFSDQGNLLYLTKLFGMDAKFINKSILNLAE